MNNEQLWQAALGEIELTLSRANFTTWFKDTFISSFENNQAVVCVPNTFTKAWLEKKYHQEILNALKSVTSQAVKDIFYKVEARKASPVSDIVKRVRPNSETERLHTEVLPINRFGLNNRYTFDNFVVGKGNELAHAACQAVAANPGNAYNPLFIYGGVGLGKTHLLQAIGHTLSKKSDKIMYITSEKFTNDYIQAVKSGQAREFKERYRNVDLLLIDDIQFMAGKDGTQEEFFHTFNELHQNNKQIVLTSDRPPKSIPALEKRLLSRFEWGMIADVGQLDVETRMAILERKCREKNYSLENEILSYVAANVQNNIRELEGALNRLIAYHEFNNYKPTMETAKNILASIIINYQQKSTNAKSVIDAVARFYDVAVKDITGQSRKKELVTPRQIIMFLLREEVNASFPTIGQELGGRDHTTAMHAHNKISKEVQENERLKQELESIKQLIYSASV
ncbi:chromosomal replication initiator protein DnaA [Candidatus Falkowbacteria bacterium]|nr:chromosomal replication initiator protein DnaA [Candidatus Falkowbacteria bacterium]